MKALVYARSLTLPFLVILGNYLGGWWNLITPAACFIVHPILNFLKDEHEAKLNEGMPDEHMPYRILELLFVPVILGLSIWGLYQANLVDGPAFWGLALSIGLINGILGFTLAHEFIHRRSGFERSIGYVLLLNNFYMHYGLEHIWGHHVYASTKEDPHTAKKGQSFYAYLLWAIAKTFINACKIERKKLQKKGFAFLSARNAILFFILLQLSLLAAIVFVFGWPSLGFYLFQSLIAITLLHVVNYLQHYGLQRKESLKGNIERMDEHHAWHSGNRINQLSLFQLENHAHHHMHPTHPFEDLKHTTGSPKYPTGYSGMIVLAFIPPLWFKVVHKRLSSFH